MSSLNSSNPVPLEAMHAHARSLLHVSQMMLYALDHEPFQASHLKYVLATNVIYFICCIKYEKAGFLGLIQIMCIECSSGGKQYSKLEYI